MKKRFHLLVLITVLILVSAVPSCKKQNDLKATDLENTTWKLTKEIWAFPNGNIQTFEGRNGAGYFTFLFLDGRKIKIVNLPYRSESIGEWYITNDKLTIQSRYEDGRYDTVSYRINGLTESLMKLQAVVPNGISSQNGLASDNYYELTKQ